MSEETKVMTAEAARAPQVGAATPAVAPKPVGAPTPASSLVAGVNRAQGAVVALPKGMVSESTKDITSPWFRGMLYGETDALKTTTAVSFEPDDTNLRIILTRGRDQLIPLRDRDLKYIYCDTMEKLTVAMQFPERVWPEWADLPNRTLVIDDITKAKDLMLDSHEFNDNGKKNNNMIVHREAKADMTMLMKSLFNKPMHIIAVAFASIYENDLTHEENVTPDLPPGMNKMLTADFSYVFYIDKSKKMLRTTSFRETYEDVDEKMVKKTFTRVIFAKNKIPRSLVGKGVINDLERMDLADIWKRIQKGAR